MGNILLEHAKKVATVNSDDPQVLTLLQRGKHYFQSAIRYDSHNFLIFRDYALFLEYMDDLDGAEEYFIRSLSINPNQMECLRYAERQKKSASSHTNSLFQALRCFLAHLSQRARAGRHVL